MAEYRWRRDCAYTTGRAGRSDEKHAGSSLPLRSVLPPKHLVSFFGSALKLK